MIMCSFFYRIMFISFSTIRLHPLILYNFMYFITNYTGFLLHNYIFLFIHDYLFINMNMYAMNAKTSLFIKIPNFNLLPLFWKTKRRLMMSSSRLFLYPSIILWVPVIFKAYEFTLLSLYPPNFCKVTHEIIFVFFGFLCGPCRMRGK
jgi:hypothetical protein